MGAVVEVASFWVPGKAEPQGSKVPGVTKDGRPYLRDVQSAALKAWRKRVGAAAAAAWGVRPLELGPVVVHVEFRFVRGVTVTRPYPTVKPDVDKLARAVLDAIDQCGAVYKDDAQVVTLRGHKVYANEAGAWVRIGVMEGTGQWVK